MRRTPWGLMVVVALVLGAGCGSGTTRAKRPAIRPPETTQPAPSTTVPPTTVPHVAEHWEQLPAAPIWLGRYGIWTGTEYIAGEGGCCDGLGTNDVVAYSPSTHQWRRLASFPLAVRGLEASVWTGHEMVVVGGVQERTPNGGMHDSVAVATGAALDPVANRWRVIAPMPAPMEYPDVAFWTGRLVLVSDGARLFRYDPATDRWSVGARPPSRIGMTEVWSGTELLAWGGADPTRPDHMEPYVVHADGFAYNPVTDSWRPIPTAPVPARFVAPGAWTGTEMVVWGGLDGDNWYSNALGKGAAYNPVTNTWRALPPSPLKARSRHFVVWTGHEVVVWGGSAGGTDFRDGAAYDPATNAWRRIAAAPASPAFMDTVERAVWTGRSILFVGGWYSTTQAAGPLGLAYTPAS